MCLWADDESHRLPGFRQFLEDVFDVRLASAVDQAIDLLALEPQIVLVDLILGGLGSGHSLDPYAGLAIIERVVEEGPPGVRAIVVFTVVHQLSVARELSRLEARAREKNIAFKFFGKIEVFRIGAKRFSGDLLRLIEVNHAG